MLVVFLHVAVDRERLRLLAAFVEFNNLFCALCRYGLKVCGHALLCAVRHESGENVGLEEEIFVVLCEQGHLFVWHLAACLHIVVDLIVETTFELGTQAGKLLRVERDVLIACGVGAHAHKVFHPCGAAQFAAAGSCATNASCLLSCSDLLHLYAHMERVGKHLDELTEVDALIGDIIEDGLVAIALIFDIADLHLQTQLLGYLSALNHRVVFAALCLVIFFHVDGLGNAVYALYVVCRLKVGFLYLQLDETSCHGDHADVVARTCLHRHDVALLQVNVVDIVVVALAGVFKLYLHEICALLVAWHVGQPVVGVELLVLSSASTVAEASVAVACYLEFHVLEICHDDCESGVVRTLWPAGEYICCCAAA